MKRLIRYNALLVLLFFVSQRAGAGKVLPESKASSANHAQAADVGKDTHPSEQLGLVDHLPLTMLCNHSVLASQASRRTQPDNTLFFQAADYSNSSESAFGAYQQNYPDRHTRYFSILFPHHFFW